MSKRGMGAGVRTRVLGGGVACGGETPRRPRPARCPETNPSTCTEKKDYFHSGGMSNPPSLLPSLSLSPARGGGGGEGRGGAGEGITCQVSKSSAVEGGGAIHVAPPPPPLLGGGQCAGSERVPFSPLGLSFVATA